MNKIRVTTYNIKYNETNQTIPCPCRGTAAEELCREMRVKQRNR